MTLDPKDFETSDIFFRLWLQKKPRTWRDVLYQTTHLYSLLKKGLVPLDAQLELAEICVKEYANLWSATLSIIPAQLAKHASSPEVLNILRRCPSDDALLRFYLNQP